MQEVSAEQGKQSTRKAEEVDGERETDIWCVCARAPKLLIVIVGRGRFQRVTVLIVFLFFGWHHIHNRGLESSAVMPLARSNTARELCYTGTVYHWMRDGWFR